MSDRIDPPMASEVVDISSTDHTFVNKSICAIYVGTGGTVIAKLAKDTTARTWKNVPDGQYLLGSFISVTRSGTTAADMVGVSGMPQTTGGS
jgi:hypothetical protein